MRKTSFAFAVVLLAAACGTSGGGILGDLGTILGSPSVNQPSAVTGIVRTVDTNSQRIDLDVTNVNNLRQTNTTGSIYYDSNTTVQYQNKAYRVTDLENGDEISVQGANNNGRYVASVITVTRAR